MAVLYMTLSSATSSYCDDSLIPKFLTILFLDSAISRIMMRLYMPGRAKFG